MKDLIPVDGELEALARQSRAQKADGDHDDGKRSFLGFTLNGKEYGADLELILQIVKPPPLTWVPRAEPYVLGVVSIRGAVVTLVDLKRLMGQEPAPRPRSARVLIVEVGGERVGLLVDSVVQVRRMDDADLEKRPALGKSFNSDYVTAVARPEPGNMVVIVDLNAILGGRLS